MATDKVGVARDEDAGMKDRILYAQPL